MGNPFPQTAGAWEAMKNWLGSQSFGITPDAQASVPQGATYSEEPASGPMYAVAMPYDNPGFSAVPGGSFAAPQVQMNQAPQMQKKPVAGGQQAPRQGGDGQDYKSLLAQMFNKGNANAGAQRNVAQDIAGLSDPYMQYLAEPNVQTDLSPLLNLIDDRTGSNLTQGYKTPESGPAKTKEMLALKNNLAQMGIQASDAELTALKDMASGTFGLEKFGYQKGRDAIEDGFKQQTLDIQKNAASKKGEPDPYKITMARERSAKDLNKSTAKFQEAFDAASGAQNLVKLAASNPIAAGAAASRMARASGEVGVLTDHDIARFGGSKAFADRMKAFVQGAESGTMTRENIAFMTDLAEAMKTNAKTERNKVIQRNVSQYTNIWGGDYASNVADLTGLPVEDISDILANPDSSPAAQGKPSIPAGTVEDGFKFKGGDPSDQKNWEAVK
jgi:hypothetical protein